MKNANVIQQVIRHAGSYFRREASTVTREQTVIEPKGFGDRLAVYIAQNGSTRVTPRQERRLRHKGNRALRSKAAA